MPAIGTASGLLPDPHFPKATGIRDFRYGAQSPPTRVSSRDSRAPTSSGPPACQSQPTCWEAEPTSAQGLRRVRRQRPGRPILQARRAREAHRSLAQGEPVMGWTPASASPPTGTRGAPACCPVWARPPMTPGRRARPRATSAGSTPCAGASSASWAASRACPQGGCPTTSPGSAGRSGPATPARGPPACSPARLPPGATGTPGLPCSPCRSPSGGIGSSEVLCQRWSNTEF